MEFVFHAYFYNISCLQHTIFLVILSHQQDALTTIEGEALKNLALKKGSIQSRRLWGVVKLNGELGNSFAVKILDN
ncbi:hypothetical protein AWP89_09875 [Escherichia coli]|uniref:hypothetical protein n=1 Tax=Escherichia coli TaxID=562 RepID=UPI0009448352|nr:hypothetical protein [Escherichia coli]OKW49425.1 hypothetical protein AWP78_04665 [Escherichia coli]OKX09526.1 hypothetical protein AWP89_09875 [Escherichia coli]OKX30701.1 hypothetical protein AWP90_01410 [Escherichia coli]